MNVARRPLHFDNKPAPEVFQQSPPGDLLPPVQRPLAGVAFFNPAAMPGFFSWSRSPAWPSFHFGVMPARKIGYLCPTPGCGEKMIDLWSNRLDYPEPPWCPVCKIPPEQKQKEKEDGNHNPE